MPPLRLRLLPRTTRPPPRTEPPRRPPPRAPRTRSGCHTAARPRAAESARPPVGIDEARYVHPPCRNRSKARGR